MNLRQIGAGILLGASLQACNSTDKKYTTSTNQTSKQTYNILENKKSGVNSINTLVLKDTLEATIHPSTTYIIKDLIKTKDPLVTNCVNYSLSTIFGELDDIKEIMRVYNPKLFAKKPADFNRRNVDIRSLDTLTIPHILPSMAGFFDANIDSFLVDKPQLADSVAGRKTCIIIAQRPDKKMGFAYYHDGVLEVAGLTSIGDGSWNLRKDRYGRQIYTYSTNELGQQKKVPDKFHARSPQGVFEILLIDENHRSTSKNRKNHYKGDPMANFALLDENRGLGSHGGQKTNGSPLSHGCFRFTHGLTKILRDKLAQEEGKGIGIPYIAQWEPFKKDMDSIPYFTQLHPELSQQRLQDSLNKNIFKDSIQHVMERLRRKDSVRNITLKKKS